MGKIKTYQIFIDGDASPNAAMQQTISGRVILEVNQNIQVNYLKIILLGESKCRWSERSGNTTTYYTSRDTITHQGRELLRHPDSPPVLVQPGKRYSLGFSFPINRTRRFPSSYNPGNYGKIEYSLEAKLDRKGAIFDDKVEIPINFVNPQSVDYPQLSVPVAADAEGTDGCCFPTGPVTARAIINKTGVPMSGGDCELSLYVDNQSKTKLTPLISVVQHGVFCVKDRSRKVKHVLSTTSGEQIAGNTRNHNSVYQIRLDNLRTCGTIANSNNIIVTYTVKVHFKEISLKESIPIVIGTSSQ